MLWELTGLGKKKGTNKWNGIDKKSLNDEVDHVIGTSLCIENLVQIPTL